MATLVSTNFTAYTGVGPFDIDYPSEAASAAAGSVLVLTLGGIRVGAEKTYTVPGFTQRSIQQGPDEFRCVTAIYERIMAGSEAGPVAVEQSVTNGGHATVSLVTGSAGIDTAALSNPATTEGSGTTVDSASVDPTDDNALVLIVAREVGASSNTITKPGSTDDSAGETTGLGQSHASYIASFTQTSGATGAKTWGGMTDSSVRHAMTIPMLNAAAGDPEGQLVGGKLITGLLAGVLVN